MARVITCRNEDDIQGIFSYDFDPFFIRSIQGITSVYNNIVVSENTMIDGATYQGSTTKQRFISMGIQYRVQNRIEAQEIRNFLYRLFKPKATGTFTHSEDGETRSIDYKVESIDIPENKSILKAADIILSCPDPFFKAMNDVVVDMARWEPLFEFLHEFQEDGEEFGQRIGEIIKDVENNTTAARIGMTIVFQAIGSVTNPAMHHIESEGFIKVGTASNPFYMNMGDIVTITTGVNNKNVTFTHEGVTTIINQYLDEDSEFIQLSYGINTLKYDADSGIDYLNVTVSYRQLYLGV